MAEPLVYHSVVLALEASNDWTPERRFSSAVLHAIDGHLPYSRFIAAGQARLHDIGSEAKVARRIREFLKTDVNPLIICMTSLSKPASARAAFQAYRDVCGEGAVPMPGPCLSGIEALLASILGRERASSPLSLSALAARLGLQNTVAAEVALLFEQEGNMPIAEVAQRLGCQRRTLERQLQRMSLSGEVIRQACRLMLATLQLGSGSTLTRIAIHAGYADTSHMTRAFRRAAGLPPSALRHMLQEDLKDQASQTLA